MVAPAALRTTPPAAATSTSLAPDDLRAIERVVTLLDALERRVTALERSPDT
jgi:hypothetical protein